MHICDSVSDKTIKMKMRINSFNLQQRNLVVLNVHQETLNLMDG